MVPYNFEDDIKNKLEKRRIQPSINSWNELSSILTKKERKKNYKFLWLISAAASFVGILIISSLFSTDNTPVIVNVPSKTDTIIKEATEVVVKIDENIEKLESIKQEDAKESISKELNQKKGIVETSSEFALNAKVNNEKVIREIELKKEQKFMQEAQEIDSLLSQIITLKADNKGVKTSDIDALLLKAQQELALQKIVDKSIKTVDAYKLLQDVEADLDKSLRVKFLETLKLNYENMKTVIAQRNN